MTQEEKELLLKDLCARLIYGIKCKDQYGDYININIYNAHIEHLVDQISSGVIKMILRPMSSMTEEERKEYKHLVAFSGSSDGAANFVDWLNKKMFAYRTIDDKDMFELGLALEAPDGMYKTK